jgi:cyclophilin family peptidyl-prolyl cis-trans isomerase
VLAQIKEDYSGDVRVVFRHFPLNSHDKAKVAVQASEAAGKQGKFWEMHDLLYEKLPEWRNFSIEEFTQWVVTQAVEIGLDEDQFEEDMTSQELKDLAEQAWETGSKFLPGTPFIIVNGQPYQGNLSYDGLSSFIDFKLFEGVNRFECPEMVINPQKEYTATIETEKGDIEIELYAEQAPLAVNSFLFLAENGWFDNVIFHRVIPGFVAQTGDPTGTGMGGPGYEFDNEIKPELKFDKPGVVGMANSGPDTNGSQFFITYEEIPNLDGNYTIFGQVISGMDVVESLTQRDPSQTGELPVGDRILSVKILES